MTDKTLHSDNSCHPTNAYQNAREELEDDLEQVIEDSIDMDWTSRTGARAVVRWLEEEGFEKARQDAPAQPLGALVQSLRCMAERAAEAGMEGNAVIAERAAGFVANVEKLVTRLLPKGQEVHHATYGDLVARSAVVRDNGQIDLMCDRPEGGGWHQLPVGEIEPIYAIEAQLHGGYVEGKTAFDQFGNTFRGTALGCHVEGHVVHELAVDPDQRITLHGPWAAPAPASIQPRKSASDVMIGTVLLLVAFVILAAIIH